MVNANLATLAVGTETSGSILSPASANGVVGIKPTVGLVSRDGIIPITADQDTAGPITRTVTDAAILLGVLAGFHASDPATAGCLVPGNCFDDYTQFLDKNALRGARIAIPPFPANRADIMNNAIAGCVRRVPTSRSFPRCRCRRASACHIRRRPTAPRS